MRVHLIKEKTIEDFIKMRANGKSAFPNWLNVIKNVDWNQPEDILLTFGSADLLGNGSNRVVFNIGGNNYRMICKYSFAKTRVHLAVCYIDTHAAYTQLCKANSQYKIRMY
ncbi:MAG: type II toxin-antitoxin system HigB family toxin [Sphingobacteriaceae bacterium]|nr:MAG: type II toxin-antitoxin system HigB family toxin [Sphingobacteriaceae bacterium]